MKTHKLLLLAVAAIGVAIVSYAYASGVKTVVSHKTPWFGFTDKKGRAAVAVFQDRPGVVSVGYWRDMKKTPWPIAVSIDKRGVYFQQIDQRGNPKVKSLRWD